jgi:FkbM family methyltransferase
MAQHGEDKWILENLKPAPGFFIEVGAFNGYNCSNTLAFEDLGWSGICVEADPEMSVECLKFRKAETICAAVGSIRHGVLGVLRVNIDDRGTSGLSQKWPKSILVPMVPLIELHECCPGLKCDLLSIDTEGTELDVWDSGGDYRPSIVIMEYQTRDLPSKEYEVISRMKLAGYQQVHRTEHNLIFTPK